MWRSGCPLPSGGEVNRSLSGIFFNFLSQNSVIWCNVFLKVYIPIFACHFYACKGDLLWPEDDLRAQIKFMLAYGLDKMDKSRLGI